MKLITKHPLVGQVFNVSKHTWIKLEQPISNGNSDFQIGDTASINIGGVVEVLGVVCKTTSKPVTITERKYIFWKRNVEIQTFEITEKALVRYHYPTQVFGAPCPDGGVFFLPVEELIKYNVSFEYIQKEKEEKKNLVESIINNSYK